jgi:hypothetical protein
VPCGIGEIELGKADGAALLSGSRKKTPMRRVKLTAAADAFLHGAAGALIE